MIAQSFCCFKGLSPEAERHLWREGCLSWEHLPHLAHRLLSPRKVASVLNQLPTLRAALDGRVVDLFLHRLPPGHRARVWPVFSAGTGFLDVETTGLGRKDEVTVVGLQLDGKLHQFVRGRNLEELLRIWKRIEVLVTFNGSSFDLPVLKRTFDLLAMPPHVDLLEEGRPYGLRGGLKEIERRIGIVRNDDEQGDGEWAVRAWNQYLEHGDAGALAQLLRYNARDVVTLPRLAEHLWRCSTEGCAFQEKSFSKHSPLFSSLTIENTQPVV